MDFTYPLSGIVTVVTLLIYMWMAMQVGKSRGKHGVPAPQNTGPDEFLRALRVHENTVEGLLLFLPALWMFALTFGDLWAALVGLFYPLGRIVYALGYYQAADKRSRGFMIGLISTIILLIGSLVGFALSAATLYL
ncbi:MAG: MAPEG family protein [Rhodobiaceae bacterium]|nr:MAPEG family protein [Rhodobiaceae bacterium]